MRSFTTIAILLILLLLPAAHLDGTPAPNGPWPQLDRAFERLAEAGHFSGVVLVARHGEVLHLRSFGKSSIELHAPTVHWNRYAIASLSKSFTAAAISILADRKLLELDDPVVRHLPGFRHRKITIRHLLLHQSGLSNPDYEALANANPTLEELVAEIENQPLQFEPGTTGRYSNAGYNVLALVIERVSGVDYATFIENELLQPLGMTSTGHFGNDEIIPWRASTYRWTEEGVRSAAPPNLALSVGSGGLWSTAADMLKWAEAVRTKRLHDVDRWEWPFGWGKPDEPHTGVEQTGLSSGYSSSIQILTGSGVVIIILSNLESDEWVGWANEAKRIVFSN